MASITKLSNSNYVSSLYNSSNIISGLASGMDTEGMIESLTQAYQTKITKLQQKYTKVEWKQEAYRSIISKMYSFSNKYTSYTSSTNLLSPSFFNGARTSVAQGENASKVSASGTSTSEVVLDSVEQLATSARYVTSGNFNISGNGNSIDASDAIDLGGQTDVSAIQGSLSFIYGSKSLSISFSESDIIEPQDGETNAQALKRVIEEKLGDQDIVIGDSTVKAGDRIDVSVSDDGTISFKDKSTAGNSVYITGSTGNIKEKFGIPDISDAKEDNVHSFKIDNSVDSTKFFASKVDNFAKVSGKSFNINVDGVTKQITGPLITKNSDGSYQLGGTIDKNGKRTGDRKVSAADISDEYAKELNSAVQKQFGRNVSVQNAAGASDKNADGNKNLKLQFTVPSGSEILINTDAGDALKIGKTASNYLNTSKTLGDLLGEDKLDGLTPNADGKYDFVLNGVTVGSYDKDTSLSKIMSDINSSEAGVKVSYSKSSREFVFTSKDTGEHTEVDMGPGLATAMFGGSGKTVSTKASIKSAMGEGFSGEKTFAITADGKDVEFKVKQSDTLSSILSQVKEKLGSEYDASFAKDGSLIVKKDGKAVNSSFTEGKDEIGQDLVTALQDKRKLSESDPNYTKGQDSRFTVTVNGTTKVMTRTTNKVEIDGLTMNFKGTFNQGYADAVDENGKVDKTADAVKNKTESVSFQSDIESDKIVDAVKNMIAEYNVMVAEIRGQYATMPPTSSSGSIQDYEPLTDEDRADMSETAIQNYEEKAKQGLLFADSNLSGLYQGLVNIFTRSGADNTMLTKMGISTSYDTNGAATIAFDENKFRQALEDDFEGVVDIFTRTASDGGTDGIMQGMKTQLDRYGSITGAVKGILVQQAGTPLASLSLLDNGWQKELDNYTTQIERIQEKLEDQIDRYTQQFARMETLINQMNNQSSQLASMMGG